MPWKGTHLSEEAKEKLRIANLGKHHTKESRMKMSESRKGRKCPWKVGGWHHTEEAKEKIRKAHIGKPGTMLGKHLTPEQIEKARRFHLGRKRSPETIRNILKASHVSPNNAEMVLNGILSGNFGDEWKYVGNGDLIIGGKCPDFMNTNGKKGLIELFGDFWHRGQNPEDRIKAFEPYGYSTLVIWEHELKNPESVIDKVRNTFYA